MHSETSALKSENRWPWAAATLGCISLAGGLSEAINRFFIFDRELISRGDWWRLWSGHFAHHNGSHLLWNVVIFIPAGVWLERIAPVPGRWFFGVGPLFISAALWLLDPSLHVYAGLSGMTVGVLTLLALTQLRVGSREPRWVWWGLLLLIAAKIGAEYLRPQTAMFAVLPNDIRNVPLAHLAGAVVASGIFFGNARRTRPS